MTATHSPLRRHLIGILSLAALLGAGAARWWGNGDAQTTFVSSISLRLGIMLGTIWLAYPQLQSLAAHVSPTGLLLTVAGLLIVVIRPRAALWIVPLLVVVGVLGWLRRFLKRPP